MDETSVIPSPPARDPRIAPLFLIVAGVMYALMASPLATPTPDWDSGVFNYVAWRMLEGDVPYRDVWDHKPPVIFFICAAGQLLGGGSLWGVVALQALSMASGLMLAYACLKSFFGWLPAFLAALLGFYFVVFAGLWSLETEEFYMLYAFASIGLYLRTLRRGPRPLTSSALGAVAMTSFLTKQILVAVPFAVVVCLAAVLVYRREFPLLLRSVAWYLLGAVSILVLILAYFGHHGAIDDFWNSAFVYNFGYAEPRHPGAMLDANLTGLGFAHASGLLYPALAGMGVSALVLRRAESRRAFGNPLLPLALLALPLEVFFTGLSGRGYPNYFLCWPPAMMILAAGALHHFTLGLPRPSGAPRLPISPRLLAVAAAIYVIAFSIPSVTQWQFNMFKERFMPRFLHRARVAGFLKEQTRPGDTVYLWGLEATVNFTARRPAGNRYPYTAPIIEPYYADNAIVEEFARSLRENPPDLIIDASRNDAWTPPLDRERWNRVVESGDKQRPREGVREIADHIVDTYVYAGRILNWHVYARPGYDVKLPPMSPQERERYKD